MWHALKYTILIVIERRIHEHYDVIKFLPNNMVRIEILRIC